MKTRLPLRQIALVAAAVVAGAVLDRFVLPTGAQSRRAVDRERSPARDVAPATSLPQTNLPAVTTSEETGASSENRDASRKSLDEILLTHEPRQRTRELQAFINALGPAEFADALKRIQLIASSSERELASRLLTAQWVLSDPDGALQFAAGNRGFDYLAADVFRERAASDFQSALKGAQEIPGHDLRYSALRGVLQFKADSDPAGALQLARTLGEFSGREPLANAVYRQWANANPQAAAAYAAQDTESTGWRSPVNQVANAWANQDPAAAAKWSLSLPEAEARARSVSEVMRQWSRDDPTSAANWIHSLPTGPSRDAAVAGLAASVAATDPSTAVGWIGTISDEAERQRVLRRVGRTVLWRDPQNGPALLQAAGLSADQIELLQRGRGR